MTDPHLWTLCPADAAAVLELRDSGDNLAAVRPITVRFRGANVGSVTFQHDMAMTGWEIKDCILNHGVPEVTMDWEDTAETEALRALSARLGLIEGAYGINYLGWSIPGSAR